MYPTNDIIYYTLFPHENAYSSVSLSFSREFIKNNRVFYINHPYSIKDFLSGWLRGDKWVKARFWDLIMGRVRYEKIEGFPEDRITAVIPPLTFPINFLQPGLLYDFFWKWNCRIVERAIAKTVKDYGLKDFIFLNCFDPFFGGVCPKKFGPALSIYQCIDDMTGEEYTAKHGRRLEEEVIRKADLTLVTSRELWNINSKISPRTHIVHNAVEMSIFEKVHTERFPRPKELEGRTGKVVGFTGNLNGYRVHYALIRKAAEAYPDKTFLIIGPLNSDDYKKHGLDQMANVILPGAKNIRDLPQYLQQVDLTIIPFLCNKLTKSVYPLKVNEYLAAGKPVVATNFSEDIHSFGEVVYLANDEEEFVRLIDRAIDEDDETKKRRRIEWANQNTWAARVSRFWEIAQPNLKKN